MALAEEQGNPSNLAMHVGTFGSQLFKHGKESSPKISLIMEGKVAWALPLPSVSGCLLPEGRISDP